MVLPLVQLTRSNELTRAPDAGERGQLVVGVAELAARPRAERRMLDRHVRRVSRVHQELRLLRGFTRDSGTLRPARASATG